MADSKKKSYKYCIVPQCKSTTVTTPGKKFITLPVNKKIRMQWQKAMGREQFIGESTKAVVCEDHFNLEEDMENYLYFRLMKNVIIKIKPGVVPHIFDCQNNGIDMDTSKPRKVLKKWDDKETLDEGPSRETVSETEDLDFQDDDDQEFFKEVNKHTQDNIEPKEKIHLPALVNTHEDTGSKSSEPITSSDNSESAICIKKEKEYDAFTEDQDSDVFVTICRQNKTYINGTPSPQSGQDEYDAVGYNVASKLRRMDENQRNIAKIIIAETLLRGQIGTLKHSNRVKDLTVCLKFLLKCYFHRMCIF